MRKCTVTADSVAIPFDDVQQAMTDGDNKWLSEFREKVVGETYDTQVEVFDGELMDSLNKIFGDHFMIKAGGKDGPLFDDRFAADTKEGRKQWKEYHTDVIEAINKYDSSRHEGWPVGVSSRVALMLYWAPTDPNIPLPILGELSVLAITSLCASVPLALTEVSCNPNYMAANPVARIRAHPCT